eukprot:5727343-Pleurochrysis_carterae.AAC.1
MTRAGMRASGRCDEWSSASAAVSAARSVARGVRAAASTSVCAYEAGSALKPDGSSEAKWVRTSVSDRYVSDEPDRSARRRESTALCLAETHELMAMTCE